MKVVLLTIMFEYVTPVHVVLERLFRELHSKGIKAVRRQSEIIAATEDSLLWEKSEMGTHSPSALLNSVFFYNGLNFVLRGGDELMKGMVFRNMQNCTININILFRNMQGCTININIQGQ